MCACAVGETTESHEGDAQDLQRKVRNALEEQCKTSKDTAAYSEPQAGILDWALWLFSNTPAQQLTDDSMCPLFRQSVGKATCVFTSNCKMHALLNSVYQKINTKGSLLDRWDLSLLQRLYIYIEYTSHLCMQLTNIRKHTHIHTHSHVQPSSWIALNSRTANSATVTLA